MISTLEENTDPARCDRAQDTKNTLQIDVLYDTVLMLPRG